jgi:hypothetical protein
LFIIASEQSDGVLVGLPLHFAWDGGLGVESMQPSLTIMMLLFCVHDEKRSHIVRNGLWLFNNTTICVNHIVAQSPFPLISK